MSPLVLLLLAVGVLGMAAGFVVPRVGWWIPIHVVAIAALVYGVFRVGGDDLRGRPVLGGRLGSG